MTLKLEVGKTYVDSKGGISNISRKLNGFYLDERGDFFRKNGEWVSSIYPDGDIDYNLIAEYKAETRCPTCNALVKERAPVVHEAIVWKDMDTVPENQDTVLIKSKDGVHLASLRTIYKESETKSYYLYDEVRGQKRKIVALKWYPLPKEKITYEEK